MLSVLNLAEKTTKMLINNLLIQVTDYSAEHDTNNNVLGSLEGVGSTTCMMYAVVKKASLKTRNLGIF